MKKIKVLRITTEVNRSSIGRTTEQIGKLVLNEGWESFIAWGRADGNSASQKIRIGSKLSVYVHVLLTRLLDMHGYGSYFATKRFIKQVKKISPDIIHLHDIHGYYINHKVLFDYLKVAGIPVVWTHHDCWAFTGHCAHFAIVECEKWKTECCGCPQLKAYPTSYYDGSRRNYIRKKALFTSLDNIYHVGVSKWICDELKHSFFKNHTISFIYNGIDTNKFKPCSVEGDSIRKKYGLGEGPLLIVVATAWSKNKGLEDYLGLRRILDEKYTILFVGYPLDQIALLPKGISGIPRTESIEELATLYSTSSIVLNLSHAESFGKSTAEGLACGVPGIVYNCTASPELVDSETGIVVERGDLKGVVDAVETIMSWDKQKTSEKCRQRACELFSIGNNWPKYIELYKQILENKNTEGNPLF